MQITYGYRRLGVWIAGFALLLATTISVAADLTVIDLRHRTAADLLPVLEPLVGRDTALSGIDYKLLVRGSAADVARIREALAVLDRAPKQLLIAVRYTNAPDNKNSSINFNTGSNRSRSTINGQITTTTQTSDQTSSVRVIEGNGAHISTGQSVPIVTAIMTRPRTGQIAGVGLGFRELTTGFDVLPRINGDRVILNIATQRATTANGSANGVADIQQVDTTIEGRIGEWIELGGVTTTSSEQKGLITTSGGGVRHSTQSDNQSVMMKVELVDTP